MTGVSYAVQDAIADAASYAEYRVLGGVLRSALPLPGLEPATGAAPDWTLHVAHAEPGAVGEAPLGREALDLGAVTLARIAGGYRLRYEDTGCFDVSADGARIVWYARPGADAELVRVDVCGRVLALALHATGALSLHASAVATPEGAIAFVAPKAHGKSSLAAALLRRGAALLTDDTLPVLPGAPPMARPGLHQLRLNADSLGVLVDPACRPREARGGKLVVDGAGAVSRCREPLPLAAIYELAPAAELPGGAIVARAAVSRRLAAVALLRHTRPAALLGGAEAPTVLARAAAVAATVPMQRLAVAAGLEHIDDVAATILAWHAGPSA